MERLDLFANLVALAGADGKFTQQEIDFLAIRAEIWGITPEEAESVLVGAAEGNLEVTVPERHGERVELLEEMIRLMAVDGDLAPEEKRICAMVSAAMEFTTQEFNDVLDRILADLA